MFIGLDNLQKDEKLKDLFKGHIALLCHQASVDKDLKLSVNIFKKIFKDRFVKIFGPQHGFVSDVQDNMIETKDFIHPYFKMPIHSLYSETRIPTDEMLKGVDTIAVDLQDVGTRVYTYISTLRLLMEKCAQKGIHVVILDRPNPVGGKIIEGNILEEEFKSFVGMLPIPQRHALTMGEVGMYLKHIMNIDCSLDVIKMEGWDRNFFWVDTKKHWINPSPNLPTPDGAITFCGTVLFEGTKLSEGRGTTRSLEVVGHPKIDAYDFAKRVNKKLETFKLEGCFLRPINFMPTFQKFANISCGGVQIHVTNREIFKSWHLGQFLMRELYNELGEDFQWQDAPYEYEFKNLAIDFINGSDQNRQWIESNGSHEELLSIENEKMGEYLKERSEVLLY